MQRSEPHANQPGAFAGYRNGSDPRQSARGKAGTIAAIGAIVLLASWAGGATLYYFIQ